MLKNLKKATPSSLFESLDSKFTCTVNDLMDYIFNCLEEEGEAGNLVCKLLGISYGTFVNLYSEMLTGTIEPKKVYNKKYFYIEIYPHSELYGYWKDKRLSFGYNWYAHGKRKKKTTAYALDFTPMQYLRDISIKINPKFDFHVTDNRKVHMKYGSEPLKNGFSRFTSKNINGGKTIEHKFEAVCEGISLWELCFAFLLEVGFHGSTSARDEVLKELEKRIEEVKKTFPDKVKK